MSKPPSSHCRSGGCCAHRRVTGRGAFGLRPPTCLVNANDLLEDVATVGELPLVTADPLDRCQVGLLERGQDLLDTEGVVSRQGLASTHIAQLVKHRFAVLMTPLI